MELYGCEYYFQSDEFKQKSKKTLLKRYGRENYFKFGTKEFNKRMIDLYGFINPMHIPSIAENVLNYKYKRYIFPSGKRIKIQGYENRTLDNLFKCGYKENDIKYKKIDMPEIWYIWNNGRHRYYPDFFIEIENLVVETKSLYTFKLEINQNIKKFLATINCGYNLVVEIY